MLKSKVLVLNKSWYAVGLVPLTKAINLLFSEYRDGEPKARIITPPPKGDYEIWDWKDWSKLKIEKGEDGIISCSQIYKIPEVLLLSKYNSIPKQRVNFCRRTIWKRDNYTCQYCGKKPKEDECTLDHIIPKSMGGATNWTNCVLACYKCNSQKANRKPEDAIKPKNSLKEWIGPSPMKLLKTPKKPNYSVVKEKIKILDTWKHWLDAAYWNTTLE